VATKTSDKLINTNTRVLLDICELRGSDHLAKVSARAGLFPVGGVGDPFALWLKIGGEGALGGMLCFFL
jgi:hypothetical protein